MIRAKETVIKDIDAKRKARTVRSEAEGLLKLEQNNRELVQNRTKLLKDFNDLLDKYNAIRKENAEIREEAKKMTLERGELLRCKEFLNRQRKNQAQSACFNYRSPKRGETEASSVLDKVTGKFTKLGIWNA